MIQKKCHSKAIPLIYIKNMKNINLNVERI
jgi:ribosomal protein L7Ae-like RNA K-turn-binding protein